MSLLAVDSIRKRWPFQRRRSAAPGAPDANIQSPDDAQKRKREERAGWDFEAGAPIGAGRSVLKRLGGGSAYEVFVVWDERLAHPSLVRGFGAVLDG